MKLRLINGLNFKKFVRIEDLKTKEDFELYETIKDKILFRKEFKPFIKSFDKTISYSYLFNEYFFPITFLDDVIKLVKQLSTKEVEIIEPDIQYQDSTLTRATYDKWVNTLKFPDKYVLDKEEYKYQHDAVFTTLKYGCNRIDVATSGGKTFITYLFYRFLFDNKFGDNLRGIVVTPRKILVQQLKEDFKEYDTYFKRKLTVESMYAGSQKIIDADIVAGTFQSLSNYDKEYFDEFNAFVCDEVHTGKTWTIRNEIYNKMYNVQYMFGMTGSSPAYKTLDYLHITSMFGPARVVKETSELITEGTANPLKVYEIQINYLDEDENNFSTSLKESGIDGPERLANEKEFFHHKTERTDILVKLLHNFKENSIIFVHTVAYCQILFDYLEDKLPGWEIFIIHGSVKNRDEYIQRMKETRENVLIIATLKTMSTGVSIPSATNGYLVDGGKSEIDIGQTLGRFLRILENKKTSRFFDFHDMMKGCAFNKHGIERLKYYKRKKFPVNTTKINI